MSSIAEGIDGKNLGSADARWLSSLSYDSPFRWNSRNLVIPGLFSQTGTSGMRSIELDVRVGALFSDGSPVTAHAIVDALERVRDSPAGWRLQNVDTIEVRSDKRARIVMAHADASIAATLAHPLLNLRTREGLGTGPFVFTEQGEYARNGLFWQIGRPHIDHLELTEITDDVQRSTAAALGEIDILPNVPLLDVPMLQREPTVYLIGGATNILCHLQVNQHTPELANREVRGILSRAIRRTQLVEVATANQAEVATTLFRPGEWAAEPDAFQEEGSDNVREQLRNLGVPSDLRLHLLADNADATLANTAVVLQEQLANCGISLSITLLEGNRLIQALDSGDCDLYVKYSAAWRDPHELVWPMLSTDGAENWSGYASAEVDTLLRAAITLGNVQFRTERYARLEQLIRRDVPVIPLFRPYVWDSVSSRFPAYQHLPPATSRGMMTLRAAGQP